MTKEKNQVVTEVKEVISSIRIKIQQDKNVTLEDIDNLSSSMEGLISDYNAALESYLAMNSLAVKFEKFLEVIGIIGYASATNTDLLDEAIKSLEKVSNVMKQK